MTTGPGGQAAGRGHLRASHADREHVIDAVKAAFVQGRLTKDELDQRVGRAFASRTYAELAAITADIPAGRPGAQPPRRPVPAAALSPAHRAALWGTCVIIAAGIAVAVLLPNPFGFAVAVLAILIAGPIAGTMMLDDRQDKHSRGQLPPQPGQHGRPPGAEQHHRPAGGQQHRWPVGGEQHHWPPGAEQHHWPPGGGQHGRTGDGPAVRGPPGSPCPAGARARGCLARLAVLAGQRVRGAHPPRVGQQLGQPPGAHLRQPQQHQRPAVVAGRGEEDSGLAE